MRERFARVAAELLDTDPRVAVLLADITADAFEAARSRHPDRVVNVGIREQLLISVAGGMALAGMRPIAHTFASFLVERPFEQIKLDLNHQGAGAILVSSGASFDYAAAGRTHQSPGDVALLGTLPGWIVHVPGHPTRQNACCAPLLSAADWSISGSRRWRMPLRWPSGGWDSRCCDAERWRRSSPSDRWPTPSSTQPPGWTSPSSTPRPPAPSTGKHSDGPPSLPSPCPSS